jgi:hypothetical protein
MLKGMIENFLPARQADKKRLTEGGPEQGIA